MMFILLLMGIWDRFETVIKSNFNNFERDTEKLFKGSSSQRDPDLDAAYEELDDFLKGTPRHDAKHTAKQTAEGYGWKDAEQDTRHEEKKQTIPNELRQDFAELGLTPQASAEECKEAYKKLIKVHHPDRHSKHAANLKKATNKTARVNASYDRIMKWFKG